MNRSYTTTKTSVRTAFAIAAVLVSLAVGVFIDTLAQVETLPQYAATTTAAARL